MAECEHINFRVDANIARVQRSEEDPTIVSFMADLRVKCADCDKPFEWIGFPMGYSPNEPRVSIDGKECRAPIKPEGVVMPIDLPSFRVEQVI
jgi:hypothetical protein